MKKNVDSHKRNQKIRLMLALNCYCRDNVKYGPLSKHFFQRTQQHGGWKSLRDNDKLFKTQCLSVITQNKKHSSKQVIAITYTLGKRFVAAIIFEGLSVAFLRREYKKMQYSLVCMSSLYVMQIQFSTCRYLV